MMSHHRHLAINIYRLKRISLTALVLAVFYSGVASGQDRERFEKLTAEATEVISLWPGDPPGPAAIIKGSQRNTFQPTKDGGSDGTIRLTDVSDPELYIYRPKASQLKAGSANDAACVICPGGGFHILAWDLEGTEVAQWLNSLGVTAAVLKYRVPTSANGPEGRLAGPVCDAQRAIRTVRQRAEEWGLDKDKVGILGFSAGGLTAAKTGLLTQEEAYLKIDAIDANDPRPAFVILGYPAWLVDDQGQLLEQYAVADNAPPAFFVHAQNDPISCLSSVALFNSMKLKGRPAELHIFADGGHGFGLRPSEMPVSHWPELAADWLVSEKFISK